MNGRVGTRQLLGTKGRWVWSRQWGQRVAFGKEVWARHEGGRSLAHL